MAEFSQPTPVDEAMPRPIHTQVSSNIFVLMLSHELKFSRWRDIQSRADETPVQEDETMEQLASEPPEPPGPPEPTRDVCGHPHGDFLHLLSTYIKLTKENISIAEGRPRRLDRRLPARFRDIIPQPLPILLPTLPQPPPPPPMGEPPSEPSAPLSEHSSTGLSLLSRLGRILQQPRRNMFGLLRKYDSGTLPVHDPEELVTLESVFDSHEPESDDTATEPSHAKSYGPYPNENSFLLGEWYHAGAEKSSTSFRDLVSIVGSPKYKPEDVRETTWDKINASLGRNDFDAVAPDDHDPDWMDVEDANWKKTPIQISVPFNSRAKAPGPKDFLAGDLYHRSLVSVIREKISNPHHDDEFHYEPYELFWQKSENGPTTTPPVQTRVDLTWDPTTL